MGDKTNWPKRMRIKSRVWHIFYVPKDHGVLRNSDDPDDWNMGCCIEVKRHIYICRDQCPETMRDTLVHELMHAVYATSPRPHGGDEEEYEENLVRLMTEAFFEVVNNSNETWWLGEDWE